MTSAMKLVPIVINETCENDIESVEEQYRKVLLCEQCHNFNNYPRSCMILDLPLNHICPFKDSVCPEDIW